MAIRRVQILITSGVHRTDALGGVRGCSFARFGATRRPMRALRRNHSRVRFKEVRVHS